MLNENVENVMKEISETWDSFTECQKSLAILVFLDLLKRENTASFDKLVRLFK
jgi:hypothetical protein